MRRRVMEEYIKVSAKTVEDAVLEASIQLGTSRDNVEYRVIEYETKGFLGIGAKKALIEAKKKKSDEDIINEVFRSSEKSGKDKKKAGKEQKKEEKKAEKKAEKKELKEDKKEEKKEAKKEEKKENKEFKEGKKEKKEPKAAKEPKEAAINAENESAEADGSVQAAAEKPHVVRTPADPQQTKEKAEKFLTDVFNAMDLDVTINQNFEDDTLSIDLAGEDMGMLIGKRGQTLDSLQYLTSLVVNKGKNAYVRVKVDTENYRDRRKATLENLAKNIAFKVKKTRRPVYLEPMNPYERRIIHSALQNDPYVTTHSEGEEPLRKVVVTLKKRDRDFYQEDED